MKNILANEMQHISAQDEKKRLSSNVFVVFFFITGYNFFHKNW